MKIVILLMSVLLIISCSQPECFKDSDCVPSQCCHTDSCVLKENAPNCQNIFCSQECKEDTLDCGQGSCRCIKGFCSAVFES